ncbi:hypothetical protein M514_07291 [Trichuris suis]|uniref:Uncharacterized protein n=1 Tax=Trichuris suis TaxID=68888 RepID=A0A085N409_9BILA|nr:hypothetical protein M513_07291 [Trichuris suis]KFD64205.1 hypothetical protein M514_07291 [Trichuris suis]
MNSIGNFADDLMRFIVASLIVEHIKKFGIPLTNVDEGSIWLNFSFPQFNAQKILKATKTID